MKRNYNFSLIIKWIAVAMISIVIINFGIILYAMSNLYRNSIQSIENNLHMKARGLESELANIHSLMLGEIGYDTDLDKLLVVESNKESLDAVAIKKRLKNILGNWSREYSYGVNYVIYYPENGIAINNCKTGGEYDLWRHIFPAIEEYLKAGQVSGGWRIRELEGDYYLSDIIYNNRRYIICYIRLEEVLASFQSEVYGSAYSILAFNAEDHTGYTGAEAGAFSYSNLSEKRGRPRIFDKYVVLGERIGDVMEVYLAIDDLNNALKIFRAQMLFGALLMLLMGGALWFLRFIYRGIVKPIEEFNENIQRLKDDEMYSLTTHYQINELGNASRLMSELVSRIKGLKIDIYEKTLEQQKTQMDFLTLQIEPHFYLNCLSNIYNMAQMEAYGDIKKLSNCVSQYLRYIFKSRENFVTVEEEWEHIEKYLEIQRMRYREGFRTKIQLAEIKKAMLPPLILQTFVENVIKHTVTWEEEIELVVTGSKIQQSGQEYAVILIEDTGEGFDTEILYKLQNGISISEGEKRIGVMNTIERMHLAFGGAGKMEFYNRESGGAAIRITFPYQEDPEPAKCGGHMEKQEGY